MKSGKLLLVLLVTAALATSGCSAPTPALYAGDSGLEVTVYNNDLGVVKEARDMSLQDGVGWYAFEGVASSIDPTSVKLSSRDGSFEVLEQNYEYDLVSKAKILEKYLGQKIQGSVVVGNTKEPVSGILLASQGGELILKLDDGSIRIVSVNDLLLPSLPEGLIMKPTLEWLLSNKGAGQKTAELSYMTSGMSWAADYVLVTDKDDKAMDLNGWVTINNNAGATFKDAALKLVAGDVNLVRPPQPTYARYDMAMESKGSVSQFQEESLFEYHMYDLGRRTTLKDNEQKQLSLLTSQGSKVEKEYVYENDGTWYWGGSDGTGKIQVKLNFNNSKTNGLGMPLPKGKVRVFKADSEGRLQFLGEDQIDHTPKDETVRILVGNAFDIVGERKQMNVQDLGCQHEITWESTLRNHKSEDVTVTVIESAFWDWKITSENYPHIKESNRRIRWNVPVKAGGESKLAYTIRYNWC